MARGTSKNWERSAWLEEKRWLAEERMNTLFAPQYDERWGAIPPTHRRFLERFLALTCAGFFGLQTESISEGRDDHRSCTLTGQPHQGTLSVQPRRIRNPELYQTAASQVSFGQ